MISTIIHRCFPIVFFLSIGIPISNAGAPPNRTPEEIALLPAYCPYTQGFQYGIKLGGTNNHPTAVQWLETIGPGFMDLHHYCWALIELQRASKAATPAVIKRGLRGSALDNLLYVVKKNPTDLVLLPEIYTWIGKTELLLDRPNQADASFEKARDLKPDYWPAYYHWGEYLFAKGKKAEALAIVKSGLENSPNTKALHELMKRLESKR